MRWSTKFIAVVCYDASAYCFLSYGVAKLTGIWRLGDETPCYCRSDGRPFKLLLSLVLIVCTVSLFLDRLLCFIRDKLLRFLVAYLAGFEVRRFLISFSADGCL